MNIIDYFDAQPEPLRAIGTAMESLIEDTLPGAGAVWHGHPVWSLGTAPGQSPVCLLKAYPAYVTFGLWRGREIVDPSGRMQTAKGMPHVKLRGIIDIDAELFADWLRQARELALPGPARSGLPG